MKLVYHLLDLLLQNPIFAILPSLFSVTCISLTFLKQSGSRHSYGSFQQLSMHNALTILKQNANTGTMVYYCSLIMNTDRQGSRNITLGQ